MCLVMCGGLGGGQPVAQPPYDMLEVEELTVRFNGGCRVGGSLAVSPPAQIPRVFFFVLTFFLFLLFLLVFFMFLSYVHCF